MLNIEKLNQYYGSSHTLRDVSFAVPEASASRFWAATAWARARCSSA